MTRRFRPGMNAPSSWSPEQAARFEAWVEGEEGRDSKPSLPRNPAAALRDFVAPIAKELGLEVDEEAFEEAIRYCDEVEPPPDIFDRIEKSIDEDLAARTPITTSLRERPLGMDPVPDPPADMLDAINGARREVFGRSALPRFNRYSIPAKVDPKAVDCPYCVKRPRNLSAHCRAVHPDKPEAR